MNHAYAPMLPVEIGGVVVRRPSVPEVVLYSGDGRPAMVRMRPQLLAGEHLIVRLGQIPMILQEEECLSA